MTKAVLERSLAAELTEHLGYERGDPAGAGSGNNRNGSTGKRLATELGPIELEVPRDRNGSFEPQTVRKGQRRLEGVDALVLGLYARGMTVRDIAAQLREAFDLDLSPDLISKITDSVLEEVKDWQARPLDAVYPVIFLDALVCKVRDGGSVKNKAAHLAVGVTVEGQKEVLGIWVETTEGAKFWLRVMNELKARGVDDVLIVVCDGLKGFPEAITAVFPKAQVQTCVVHLIRHSLAFVSYKDRKLVAAALKRIYKAKDADAGKIALEDFSEGPWGKKYPAIAQSWRRNWPEVVPFFAFPDDVRRIIYTTNAIESLNAKLRRAVRSRGHFPTDDAALKLLFLVLNLAAKEWKMPSREWAIAKAQLAILFEDRFTLT